MYKKYQFPLNIFLVFEKVSPIIYTSEVLTPNHYVCFLPIKWFYGINQFIKNELFYNFSTLMEASAIDTLKYSDILPEIDIILHNNRFIVFNIYYVYLTKIRLTFIVNFNGLNSQYQSVEKLYKNAN
jgi:NADH:ubiquinone oxidoreductase subunit C